MAYATAKNPPPLVAIIGSACRLPGSSSSPSKLWDLIRSPRDLLRTVPRDRFYWEGVHRPDGTHGSSKTKNGYWLDENIRQFDPQFFNINPAEAESLDPQHRLLLENVYEAIECAGLSLEDLQGTDTGVFVGMMSCDYFDNANRDWPATTGQILTTGTSRAMASNRISYAFDLRGPSLTLDTACSSSLMAVHLAVSSLRRGESTLAFACGTQLNLTPSNYVALSKMNMISSDGRSKHFDESANGYGKGEGVGVVCLKLLDQALADGDHIECVIRETGTNQDGHTKGITMPSAEAQASLIRKTYASAGLDLKLKDSRPDYFEAHGTGTPVGDPLEAKAVVAAFFPEEIAYVDDEFIHFGSIKTLIGHTEGTAGVAGLLKASQAIQHGVIPPNFLFKHLNPKVAPYIKHLRLGNEARPWPRLPAGRPRRASINSFGFGGSNVHCIIESFESPTHEHVSKRFLKNGNVPLFTPFTFSAVSERALLAVLQTYIVFLEEHQNSISPRDLAWTLQYKRSQFQFRYAVSATSLEDLRQRLKSTVAADATGRKFFAQPTRSNRTTPPRVFCIFTGQSAQWATMGKALIRSSSYARNIINKLELALAALPPQDRPTWKISEELMADASRSHLNQAAFAQPLTTALQIMLVDLLKLTGVKLQAIIGHSSGEMAAAYAAGFISAADAIRIAYYRGLNAALCAGREGRAGTMMATGQTREQAVDLCNLPQFKGRIVVACINSPYSMTLSGDIDAIDEAYNLVSEQGIFAKILKVDKAYHSLHMQPITVPYLKHMDDFDLQTRHPPIDSPIWYSSVHLGNRMTSSEQLGGKYWVDNAVSPVLFSDAVATAISDLGVPDLFLEIGPHNGLKAAIEAIAKETFNVAVTYESLLLRNKDDVVAFSDALGTIWTRHGRSAIDLANFEATMSGRSAPKFIRDLPPYPWQHDKEYWWENRLLRRRDTEKEPPNDLLGKSLSVGASHEAKWRTFLKPKGVPWLTGHQLNGTIVLPGSAHIVMAVTAATRLFTKGAIEMVEAQDVHFDVALTFPHEDSAVETVLTIANITRNGGEGGTAEFAVDFCSDQRADELMTACRGKLKIHYGADDDRCYPEHLIQHAELRDVEPNLFYSALSDRGYGWTGPFQSITSLRRRKDFATGKIRWTQSELIFHPALLDGLFQASFAAMEYPNDSAASSFLVPKLVRGVKVFPARCAEIATACDSIHFDATKTGRQEYGGVLYDTSAIGAMLQLEGFCVAAFKIATPEDDLTLLQEVVWRPNAPSAQMMASSLVAGSYHLRLAIAVERVMFFYLERLGHIPLGNAQSRRVPRVVHLLALARSFVSEVKHDKHPYMRKEWLSDTEGDIADIKRQYPGLTNNKLVIELEETYASVFRHLPGIANLPIGNDSLDEVDRQGLGLFEVNSWVTHIVQTLANRSPSVRILEFAEDVGSVTGSLLSQCEFSTYTFTSASVDILDATKAQYKSHADRMIFRPFDLKLDPLAQGFEEASFEVVVATNVFNAREDITLVLQRIRKLLRPGGSLVCLELSARVDAYTAMNMAGVPRQADEFIRKAWSPALAEEHWESRLKCVGFSGIDAITPTSNDILCPYRAFLSVAVNEKVLALRAPFANRPPRSSDSVMIIGSDSTGKPGLTSRLAVTLAPFFKEVIRISSLETIEDHNEIPNVVMCLVELEEPVFASMTAHKFSTVKRLFQESTDVLWVTTECRNPRSAKSAYGQAMIGLGRNARQELRHLRLQFLDVDRRSIKASVLAASMLRWHLLGQWAEEGFADDIVFPQETEMVMEDGKLLVPSVLHSKSMNDRYNSQKRRITERVQPHDIPIQALLTDGQYALHAAACAPSQPLGATATLVKIMYTTLHTVRINDMGYLFVGIGICKDGTPAVVLTETLHSISEVPNWAVLPCPASKGRLAQYLRVFVAHLITDCVVGDGLRQGPILVIPSDPLSIYLMSAKANQVRKKVIFITSNPALQFLGAIYLHKHCSDYAVRKAIPAHTSVFFNCSDQSSDDALFRRISSMLPTTTAIKGPTSIYSPHASPYRCIQPTNRSLKIVSVNPATTLYDMPALMQPIEVSMVSPNKLAQQPLQQGLRFLDWTGNESVQVSVQASSTLPRFSAMKTYVVIGTGDMPQSICEWMIENGAKYFVLASRKPKHATQTWAHSMKDKGALVEVVSVDVTDVASVRHMITAAKTGQNGIKTQMPPIGGILQLAAVFADEMFATMSFEQLEKVTEVKAKGSQILHEETIDEPLDFFIMASSVSYTVGNPGQASYVAANAFMVGLANYRRSLGLPAAVIDIGLVVGIGYVMRSNNEKLQRETVSHMRQGAMYPISERDLHELFAEGVLASPARSGLGPEIITSLRSVEHDMVQYAPWSQQPMFGHIIARSSTKGITKRERPLSVREKLSNAMIVAESSPEAIRAIVASAFLSRLGLLLQIDAQEIDEGVPLLDLGIDSLVATEIGSWGRKELKVNIPISMIFGDATSKSIIDLMVEQLDASWLTGKAVEQKMEVTNKVEGVNEGVSGSLLGS